MKRPFVVLAAFGWMACSLTDLSGFTGGPPATDAGSDATTIDASPADASSELDAASPPGCGQGPEVGLVAYWPMEEGSSYQVADCSTNQIAAKIVGSATWIEGRRKDTKAIAFNGGSISIPAKAAFDFTGSFSVAAWVWFADNHNSGVISRGDQKTDRGWSLEMEQDRTLSLYVADANQVVHQANSPPAPVMQWIHVAWVFDAGHAQTIYVNGLSVASLPDAALDVRKPTLPVEIGRGWGSCCEIQGRLDELRVFSRALSASEVVELAAE